MPRNSGVPNDVEAEEAVLGAILIDQGAIAEVAVILSPEDFYREKNMWVYEAILAVHAKGMSVDQVTVARELNERDRLDAVGSLGFLSHLVATVPTSVHAADYAECVAHTAFSRRLVAAGAQIASIGWNQTEPSEAMAQVQERLLALTTSTNRRGLRKVGDLVEEYRAAVARWVADPSALRGVTTGFPELDRKIGGFTPGTFYVLAARPSMGKSAMALTFALNAAKKGTGVIIFSLEMSELALLYRMTLSMAKLNRYDAKAGGEQWANRFWQAYDGLADYPIWLDDSAVLTTADISVRVAQFKARHPELGLVITDYGDLINDEGQNEENRISLITKRLAALTKTANVAVLGVYQLNRAVEARPNKRPILSDLRSSGVIEQRADMVIMLYRPEYYREIEGEQAPPDEHNLLELLIRKQRDGETGMVKMYFDRATGFIGEWQDA
jgi:replicative DNA helicase